MRPVPGSNIRSAITIGQIMQRIIASGKITRSDELFFFKVLSSEHSLSPEDMKMLRDVMKRMDMGLIKLDEH